MLHDAVRKETAQASNRRKLVMLSGMREILDRVTTRDEADRREKEALQETLRLKAEAKARRRQRRETEEASRKSRRQLEVELDSSIHNLRGKGSRRSSTFRANVFGTEETRHRASMMSSSSVLPPTDSEAVTPSTNTVGDQADRTPPLVRTCDTDDVSSRGSTSSSSNSSSSSAASTPRTYKLPSERSMNNGRSSQPTKPRGVTDTSDAALTAAKAQTAPRHELPRKPEDPFSGTSKRAEAAAAATQEERNYEVFMECAKRGDPGWVDLFLTGDEAEAYKEQIVFASGGGANADAVLNTVLGLPAVTSPRAADLASAGAAEKKGTIGSGSRPNTRGNGAASAKKRSGQIKPSEDLDGAHHLIEELMHYTSPSLILATHSTLCPHCRLIPDKKVAVATRQIFTGIIHEEERVPPNVRPLLFDSLDRDMWEAAVYFAGLQDDDLTEHVRRAAATMPKVDDDGIKAALLSTRKRGDGNKGKGKLTDSTQAILTLARMLSDNSEILLKSSMPAPATGGVSVGAISHRPDSARTDSSVLVARGFDPGQVPEFLPPTAAAVKRAWLLKHRFATTLDLSVWQSVTADIANALHQIKQAGNTQSLKASKKVHTASNELNAVAGELKRLHATLDLLDEDHRRQVLHVAALETKLLEHEKRYHVLKHSIGKNDRMSNQKEEAVDFLKAKLTGMVAQHAELNRILAVAASHLRPYAPEELNEVLQQVPTRAALSRSTGADGSPVAAKAKLQSTARVLMAGRRAQMAAIKASANNKPTAAAKLQQRRMTILGESKPVGTVLSTEELLNEGELRERFLGKVCDACGYFQGSTLYCPRTGLPHPTVSTSYFQQAIYKPKIADESELPVSRNFAAAESKKREQERKLNVQLAASRRLSLLMGSDVPLPPGLDSNVIIQHLFPGRLPALPAEQLSKEVRAQPVPPQGSLNAFPRGSHRGSSEHPPHRGVSKANNVLDTTSVALDDAIVGHKDHAFALHDISDAVRVVVDGVYDESCSSGSNRGDSPDGDERPPDPDASTDELRNNAAYATWRLRRRARKLAALRFSLSEEEELQRHLSEEELRRQKSISLPRAFMSPAQYLNLVLKSFMQAPSPEELQQLALARPTADPYVLRSERLLREMMGDLRDLQRGGGDVALSVGDALIQERMLRRDIAVMTQVLKYAHVPSREMLVKASELEQDNSALEAKMKAVADRNASMKSEINFMLGRPLDASETTSGAFNRETPAASTTTPTVTSATDAAVAAAKGPTLFNLDNLQSAAHAAMLQAQHFRQMMKQQPSTPVPAATGSLNPSRLGTPAAESLHPGDGQTPDGARQAGRSPRGQRFGPNGTASHSSTMPNTVDFDFAGIGYVAMISGKRTLLQTPVHSSADDSRRPSKHPSHVTTPRTAGVHGLGPQGTSFVLEEDLDSFEIEAENIEAEVLMARDALRKESERRVIHDFHRQQSTRTNATGDSPSQPSSPKSVGVMTPSQAALLAVVRHDGTTKELEDAIALQRRCADSELRRVRLLEELRARHVALEGMRRKEVEAILRVAAKRDAELFEVLRPRNAEEQAEFERRKTAAEASLESANLRLAEAELDLALARQKLSKAEKDAEALEARRDQHLSRRADGTERASFNISESAGGRRKRSRRSQGPRSQLKTTQLYTSAQFDADVDAESQGSEEDEDITDPSAGDTSLLNPHDSLATTPRQSAIATPQRSPQPRHTSPREMTSTSSVTSMRTDLGVKRRSAVGPNQSHHHHDSEEHDEELERFKRVRSKLEAMRDAARVGRRGEGDPAATASGAVPSPGESAKRLTAAKPAALLGLLDKVRHTGGALDANMDADTILKQIQVRHGNKKIKEDPRVTAARLKAEADKKAREMAERKRQMLDNSDRSSLSGSRVGTAPSAEGARPTTSPTTHAVNDRKRSVAAGAMAPEMPETLPVAPEEEAVSPNQPAGEPTSEGSMTVPLVMPKETSDSGGQPTEGPSRQAVEKDQNGDPAAFAVTDATSGVAQTGQTADAEGETTAAQPAAGSILTLTGRGNVSSVPAAAAEAEAASSLASTEPVQPAVPPSVTRGRAGDATDHGAAAASPVGGFPHKRRHNKAPVSQPPQPLPLNPPPLLGAEETRPSSLVLGVDSVARRAGPGSPHLLFHPQHAGIVAMPRSRGAAPCDRPGYGEDDDDAASVDTDAVPPSIDDGTVPTLYGLSPLARRAPRCTAAAKTTRLTAMGGEQRHISTAPSDDDLEISEKAPPASVTAGPTLVVTNAQLCASVTIASPTMRPVPPPRHDPAATAAAAARRLKLQSPRGETTSGDQGSPSSLNLVAIGSPASLRPRPAFDGQPRPPNAGPTWAAFVRLDIDERLQTAPPQVAVTQALPATAVTSRPEIRIGTTEQRADGPVRRTSHSVEATHWAPVAPSAPYVPTPLRTVAQTAADGSPVSSALPVYRRHTLPGVSLDMGPTAQVVRGRVPTPEATIVVHHDDDEYSDDSDDM
jgi:hypothetical protein